MSPLTERDIDAALRDLPRFTVESDALLFTHDFGSFRDALSFLVRVGFEAEELNHHPEIRNVYGTVELRLTTHDAGDRITARDVELAQRVSALI